MGSRKILLISPLINPLFKLHTDKVKLLFDCEDSRQSEGPRIN
jgi:hypothetical protein